MRRKQVLCFVFRKKNEDYEFLLLKRISEKGGFWQPPSGGMEISDGSFLETAVRELKEETSISKEKINQIIEKVYSFEINRHYLTGQQIDPIEEQVFGFEVSADIKISIDNNLEREHEDFIWVTFEDALKLLKWDNNKDALKKLINILETKK